MTGIAANPERKKKQEQDDISHRKQNTLEHLHGSQLLNYSVAGENRTFVPTDISTLSN